MCKTVENCCFPLHHDFHWIIIVILKFSCIFFIVIFLFYNLYFNQTFTIILKSWSSKQRYLKESLNASPCEFTYCGTTCEKNQQTDIFLQFAVSELRGILGNDFKSRH